MTRAPGILEVQETKAWEWMDSTLQKLFTASWKWSPRARHVYLWTFPIALPARVVAAVVLLAAICATFIYGTIYEWFRNTYRGEAPPL